jgi:hypothetical protein
VEATAEDLSDGVKRALGPSHPAAEPRHALNDFQWQLPTTLPVSGPPPVLTNEPHSFARLISGCFYDTVRFIFQQTDGSQAALWQSAETAGKLLIAGVKAAPQRARFYQAVGRSMILADEQLFTGKNQAAITKAFERHGITLGTAAMLAPTAALEGKAPTLKATAAAKAMLPPAARKDLLNRLGAHRGAPLDVSLVDLGGHRVVKAVHHREIPLGDVHPRLRGVVALATEPVLVGAQGGRAAILGMMPEESTSADEVKTFVEMLVRHNRIAFDGTEPPRKRGATKARRARAQAAVTTQVTGRPTHAVRARGKKKMLVRIRFLCGGRREGRG